MTDIALNLLRLQPVGRTNRERATSHRVGGKGRYRLLLWAFRNSR